MSELQPIHPGREKQLDDLPRIRWKSSGNDAQIGWLLHVADYGGVIYGYLALEERTRTVAMLSSFDFEYDQPKDDAGNPK